MTGLTRRLLLAGATLLPAMSVAKTTAATATGDGELLHLAAQWWRLESVACAPSTSDTESDALFARRTPLLRAIVSTPATTAHGLLAKLRIYREYFPSSDTDAPGDVLASALQDLERLASKGGPA